MNWEMIPSWGIGAPDCLPAPWSRDNHLGNGVNGYMSSYNWTLPKSSTESCISKSNCNCVLRMRYNISTSDINGFGFTDFTSNGANAPLINNPYSDDLKMTTLDVTGAPMDVQFQLAVDTTQFARTFQDRSYMFHIKSRPSGVSSIARIYNLNVRGKRGNIVQAYPATEYDFTPEDLQIKQYDYIHFQWTGCDTNPAGNAGEGTAQTDRSNMVQIPSLSESVPASDDWISSNKALFESKSLRQRMAWIDQTTCLSLTALEKKNNNNENNIQTDPQNCFKLNNAQTPYFDGGLIKMNTSGVFYYMSSRNNNFSNRGQKGSITVSRLLPDWAIALTTVGGFLFLSSGGVAGAMLYSKAHPHSKIAAVMTKI
jgi:hypothetical protein